jgi:hypothetical protein
MNNKGGLSTDKYIYNIDDKYEAIKQAILDQEGCELSGYLDVSRVRSFNICIKFCQVPGNFHISAHGATEILVRLGNELGKQKVKLSYEHKIKHLSFGNNSSYKKLKKKFKDVNFSPLDGSEMKDMSFSKSFNYYLNVVSTQFLLDNKEYEGHQFTVNKNEYFTMHMPSVFFR